MTPFIELFKNFFVTIDALFLVKKIFQLEIDMTRIGMKIAISDIRVTIGAGGFGMG